MSLAFMMLLAVEVATRFSIRPSNSPKIPPANTDIIVVICKRSKAAQCMVWLKSIVQVYVSLYTGPMHSVANKYRILATLLSREFGITSWKLLQVALTSLSVPLCG